MFRSPNHVNVAHHRLWLQKGGLGEYWWRLGHRPLAWEAAVSAVKLPSGGGMASSCAGKRVCSSSTYSRQRDTHFWSQAGTLPLPGPHASAQSLIPNFCSTEAFLTKENSVKLALLQAFNCCQMFLTSSTLLLLGLILKLFCKNGCQAFHEATA